MSWNGHTVIDMDAHIRERADKFFKDYIDPEYRAPFNLLCDAIARQERGPIVVEPEAHQAQQRVEVMRHVLGQDDAMHAGRSFGLAHVDRADASVMVWAAQAAQVQQPLEGMVVVIG